MAPPQQRGGGVAPPHSPHKGGDGDGDAPHGGVDGVAPPLSISTSVEKPPHRKGSVGGFTRSIVTEGAMGVVPSLPTPIVGRRWRDPLVQRHAGVERYTPSH